MRRSRSCPELSGSVRIRVRICVAICVRICVAICSRRSVRPPWLTLFMELKTASSTGSVHGIVDMVRGAVEVSSVPTGERTAGEWMDVLTEISTAMSVLASARDVALVRLAAIDEVVNEDGVIVEQVNGLGTVSLDAAAMAATAQGVTTRFAQDQVEQAVTRVVRVPAIREAMVSGRLDDYKARCIAGELAEVPPDLARAVVTALEDEMPSKSGPALRRRTRDILFALAPELLKERIRAARNNVGLRRRAGEPGTDTWEGVFPSERSAEVWAAVTALAQQYKAAGTYPTLDQARAHAVLDLISGNASVETVLHVTVSADALAEAAAATSSTDEAHDFHAPRDENAASDESAARDERAAREGSAAPDESAPREGSAAATAAVSMSIASARSADATEVAAPVDRAGRSDSSLETFMAVKASRANECTWVPLSALTGALSLTGAVPDSRPAGPSAIGLGPPGPGSATRVVHPATGALLDPDDSLMSEAYRPGARLRRLIRLRDGRCRFPGCAISARQCDIDHVVPWPFGPTAASNLILLCRRHHRVKQRHRWALTLLADARVEWIDPTGRRLLTWPVDHLLVGTTRVVQVPPATSEQIAEMREDEAIRDLLDHCDKERRAEAADLADPGPPAPWEVENPVAMLCAQAIDELMTDLTAMLDAHDRDCAGSGTRPVVLSAVERQFGERTLSAMGETRDHHLEQSRVPGHGRPFRLDGTPVGRIRAGFTPGPRRTLRGWATEEDRRRLSEAGITDRIHLREQARAALEAHEQARLAAAWDAAVQRAKTRRIDIRYELCSTAGVGGIRYRLKRRERRAIRRERRRHARIQAQIRDGGPPF